MDYEKIRAYRNSHNPFAQRLGIYLAELRPGYAKTTKTVGPEDLNPLDVPHGGVYFSMADHACGSAMACTGYMAVTVDANYHFLRSAKVGDVLTAEAREIKMGKTLCTMEARVTTQEGVLLGTGTFTFYRLDKPIPEEFI